MQPSITPLWTPSFINDRPTPAASPAFQTHPVQRPSSTLSSSLLVTRLPPPGAGGDLRTQIRGLQGPWCFAGGAVAAWGLPQASGPGD